MDQISLSYSDAYNAVNHVIGTADKIKDYANIYIDLIEKGWESIPSELRDVATIAKLDKKEIELEFCIHRRKVRGWFDHAINENGYLVGQFVFSLINRDNSENILWSFNFDQQGRTTGTADSPGYETGIYDRIVLNTIIHLTARVQLHLTKI